MVVVGSFCRWIQEEGQFMSIHYGVLRAKPDRFKREDGGGTPHLQVRVLDGTGQPWRIAVNVQSGDGSDVVYWVVDPVVGHPILGSLAALPAGFSAQGPSAGRALDYVKAPLFDWALGRILPPTGSASGDDLQDLLSLYLDQCKTAGGEVFAFGAKFDQNLHKPIDVEFGNTDGLHGIHDIHLNQGNVGQHAGDNAAFHDGGILLSFPDRVVGLFLGFQTQKIPTDASGKPLGSAQTLGALVHGTVPAPRPANGAVVYLERALVNPSGPDPGREVVVIGNLATTAQVLTGWRVVDKNAHSTTFDVTVGPGESVRVTLDGTGAQLGNQGGNLILQDASGDQVDTVTYSASDASSEDHFVRFRR
jgi:uncharacterized protein YukJ